MRSYIDRLKVQAEENPLFALAIAAGVATAAAKLMQANTDRKNAQSWAREVERRRNKL